MVKFLVKSKKFLSSVRTASFFISLIIVSSIVGTFFNQPTIFTSRWYISILLLVVLSLFICSYNRFVFLIKAKKYNYLPHLKRTISITQPSGILTNLHLLEKSLKKKRFSILRIDNRIIAEKYSFSRWGSFIIHIGLIVMALGMISKVIPGWYLHDFIWLKEGESVSIPQTNYTLTNKQFLLEKHKNGSPKLYQTDVQLKNNENHMVSHSIRVNQPLKADRLSILQSDYQQVFSEMNIEIMDANKGKSIGNVTLDLFSPRQEIMLEKPYVLVVKDYFPNLVLAQNNQPISKDHFPKHPAFVFHIKNTETNDIIDKQWFILRNYTDPSLGQQTNFTVELQHVKQAFISGLILHRDVGSPLVFTGLFITVIGLFMALYFQHKKITITTTPNEIMLEARTNSNIEGLKLELTALIHQWIEEEEKQNGEMASHIL